jgi:hypothetical protein
VAFFRSTIGSCQPCRSCNGASLALATVRLMCTESRSFGGMLIADVESVVEPTSLTRFPFRCAPTPKFAAVAMRRILVDYARARQAAKRAGGKAITLDLNSIDVALPKMLMK